MNLAREYFQRVLSPWAPGVKNPLLRHLEELEGEDLTAVDVGSGLGVLVGLLAQSFGRVVGIDRDRKMVEAAGELIETLRGKGAAFGEIELIHGDWADASIPKGAALVCAVNSILETDLERRRRMLWRIAETLAPTGTFLGIFPSMEAQIHLRDLYVASLADQGYEPDEVREMVHDELTVAHSFDPEAGTFASRGEEPQKFYFETEIRKELLAVGLEPGEVSRVVYPWEVCAQVDAGYFPGRTELWDWFVRARPAS